MLNEQLVLIANITKAMASSFSPSYPIAQQDVHGDDQTNLRAT
jgi:hypothetical protein